MRKLIKLFIGITFLFSSCSNDSIIISYDIFEIYLPNTWSKIQLQGIDSKISGILTATNDTIFIDYGLYSLSFKETIPVFSIEQIRKYDSLKMDTKDLKRSITNTIDQNQAVFHKEYYYYYKNEHNTGKIRIPKKAGKGITGISFRNVNASDKHLTIYGKDLDFTIQRQLVNSFESIKFIEKK